ncbi:putative O-glycosylation ligase, exosortase A system-associated [Candidatus Nitrospira neomarina]|uniref:O-glycosylation ligase, exosortase A system-associated n=1 Tax=Candidatus Nitrospira neomarina TaxID=3020899 RepID=A0AA96K2B9_9BACT|nr:putative O-glycosylation ligase, exosortase A system-associated [Candidatus Nitrospira neomarina]WNM63976.1 putative O-glycosylation ligase, exosortase A system-associated [Candidatus Nitrospira neomarina]
MRDALVILIVIGSLPFCFLKPWVGVLMWSWLGYMNPHRLTWGIASIFPFAQMVAVATLGGLFFSKERYRIPWNREFVLLILLWLVFFCSTMFAEYQEDAWNALGKVSKVLLMTFVTILVIQDREKIRWLLYVMALSIGYYGFKGGIWAVMTGGQYRVLGPEGSFMEGNTEIGLALVMILPILLFLRRDETRVWLRRTLLAFFVFSIVAILVTYSRGALLGLGAVLAVIFLKSRSKFLTLFLLALAIPVALEALPEKWFSRMDTIQTYEEDGSSMERINAWTMATRVGLDRPLLGAGFRAFTPEMYARYFPEAPNHRVDAHSIFFQVLAEHGFTGLALFAGLIVSSILSVRKMIRIAKDDPEQQWVLNYAQMLEASLVGYVVSGLFLSRSYFDLFYHLVAIVIILKALTVRKTQETLQMAR